jgi:hypothetical protein
MKLAIAPLVLSTATFGLMLGVSQNAQASGLIRNVNATATGFTGTAVPLGNLAAITNGNGLPLNQPSLTGAHAATTGTNLGTGNSWRSVPNSGANPIGNLVLEFNLNGIYNLAGFSFWNTSGSTDLSNQGIKDVTIEYKLGAGGSWTALTGAPTSFLAGSSSTGGAATVQQFNFAPVYATNVRFRNMSNFGSLSAGNNRVGLNEIQFTSIPEPSSTLALLALGLAGVGLRKRV